ncbi:lysylphosphatidylglycerol synthase transmembrane domain-containing protein [Halegenticoccus tardaugens]|uniref:lysylphosphatidylglycerol synthase transmembrane domain-containing protein n=1 Tax=Halegenticoccus tardaugens TaxID=2071624 RepID=UPI00100BAAA6|nr:lysylphosphatidylglycerol synthase transmembrane domain-containing protein [Halegenticoccus tardaugens]
MVGERIRTTVVGFAGALVVFAILFSFVGVDRLVAQLSAADAATVALVVFVTIGWLAAWSLALRTVLAVLGVEISSVKAFLVFAGATFSNNITPFGQAGGEPVTALLISRTADAEYETGLAAIASVDTLNFVPSMSLALIGVGYFATETTLGRNLELAVGAVVVLGVAVPALIYVGWQRRYSLERRAVRRVTPAIQRIAGVLPRVSAPSAASIERRVGRFFQAIERVALNPRGLAMALLLSTTGWAFQMLGLWLSFEAIGASIPLSITLFVVPMAAIAGVTPLPGGAGGIESMLVVLLLAATGPAVTEPIALAAVVIYRGAVYWVPILIGGAVMGVVGVRERP